MGLRVGQDLLEADMTSIFRTKSVDDVLDQEGHGGNGRSGVGSVRSTSSASVSA